MDKRALTFLCFVFLFLLIALGFTVAALYTDFWYKVDASNSTNATVKDVFSYEMGMWRTCYKYSIPAGEYHVSVLLE